MAKIWPLLSLTVFLHVGGLAQAVPSKIISILNGKNKGWTLIENKCGEKKAVFKSDFNNDGIDDYVIQLLATNEKGKKIISLVAFYSSKSDFAHNVIFEDSYEGRGVNLAFELLPEGTDLKLDPPYDLKLGGARVYVCNSEEFYLWRIENGRIGGGYNRYYVIS